MERDQFVDVDARGWWLVELQVDPALEPKRTALGECWGWTDLQWFADRQKMEEMFRFLEANGPDLLRQLDEANDVNRRSKWLDDLIEAKRPAAPHTAVQETSPATVKPAGATPAGATAAKKTSPFARMKPAGETQSEQTTDTPAATGAAAPTEAAAPRRPSPFGKKAAPAAEPVAQPPAAESVEHIKESLSELAADPDVPISQEEVEELLSDPNFEKNLADAESAIEAELEAELAAVESEE